MLQTTFVSRSTADLHKVARAILDWKPWIKIYALQGKMGAGKTTLIKAIGEVLQLDEVVSSPTFALVNEYTMQDGEPVYHFDFYRIKNLEEVYDIGYEEYLYSGNYCFIEWPELIRTLLPENHIWIEITEGTDGHRTLSCTLMEYSEPAD
ncbi:MAG: tRNA (adenosine(37)-N6)-threonylcarbamoyltransferase complex ATPase subunit type 1 TsaE [bacterium]|jgi:tRNA threonylcarbamoyladenosine biosynthesis protein TsaE